MLFFNKKESNEAKPEKKMLNIAICSRRDLIHTLTKIQGRVALVSINDTGATTIDGGVPTVYCFCKDSEGDDGLQPEDAKRIADFIQQRIGCCCYNLVFQCSQGITQSAGVAAAVLTAYGLDEGIILDNPRFSINARCYRLVCNAFGLEISDEDIAAAQQRSRAARQSARSI